jgi:UDP-N-acetylmuramoylalanine--D-glutamate ligase
MAGALVYGMGQAGEAVARQLLKRGYDVVAADDRAGDDARARSKSLSLELVVAPDDDELAALVNSVEFVCPAPGVPIHHRLFAAARDAAVPAWSEFELASQWGHPPLLAVTGTNGKTTVCTLVTDMLAAAGLRVVAAGNNELPLVDALDQELDAIVVEASSFRLELTETFRPVVGTWLNISEDHLDWHGSFAAYTAAKEQLWAHQAPDDIAIANADEPIVRAAASRARSRVLTFALDSGTADARLVGDDLVVHGDVVLARTDMPRAWPHDVSNALAATLTALAGGADLASCQQVLATFRGLPHRVQLIGDAGGVRFYDDSKATTPASVVTAVGGFDSVVLIAGGRNKGLDLGVLATVSDRIRAVVAIGDAAGEVEAAFAGLRPVMTATSMDEAVGLASDRATDGDAVLLSPGCSSFDWYGNYAERGDDFARAVNQLLEAGQMPTASRRRRVR